MEFNDIKIDFCGYAFCKSTFYTVHDCSNREFHFTKGVNRLEGEIDDGIFGISYIISMYDYLKKTEKESFSSPHEAIVNGSSMKMSELTKYSCYLDTSYPLLSSNKPIIYLIKKGLSKTALSYTADEILELFKIQAHHHYSSIKQSGNEKFKAMAAISFCFGKDVFCFPWLSKSRYKAFNNHMPFLLDLLASLDKTIILPIGK